jgi:hypothetical protein
MRFLIALVVITLGCSAKKEEPKQGSSSSNGQVDNGKPIDGDLLAKAKAVADKSGAISSAAFTSGAKIKDALRGKVDPAKLDYEIAIDQRAESASDYASRIAGMRQLTVGSDTVAVTQDTTHPLGDVYKWQYRMLWRTVEGHVVRLLLFTNHEIHDPDLIAAGLAIIPLSKDLPEDNCRFNMRCR